MTPYQINTIVLLLMLVSLVIVFANKNREYRILEVGAFVAALFAQAYYTSIAENMVAELLFTLLWAWLTFRSYQRNYIIPKT